MGDERRELRLDRCDLPLQVALLALPIDKLPRRREGRENAVDVRLVMVGPLRHAVGLDVSEEGGELVIIFLRNGIEHVVVAARTAEREPEKRRARRPYHLVDFVPGGDQAIVRLVVPDAQTIKTGRDDRFAAG